MLFTVYTGTGTLSRYSVPYTYMLGEIIEYMEIEDLLRESLQ